MLSRFRDHLAEQNTGMRFIYAVGGVAALLVLLYALMWAALSVWFLFGGELEMS